MAEGRYRKQTVIPCESKEAEKSVGRTLDTKSQDNDQNIEKKDGLGTKTAELCLSAFTALAVASLQNGCQYLCFVYSKIAG